MYSRVVSRYRHDFALLHPSKPELLVLSRDGGLELPSTMSENWLPANDLLKALRSQLHMDAVMLRPVRYHATEPDTTTILYALVASTDTLPVGARWLGLETLQTAALNYPDQHVLETILLEDAEPGRVPVLRLPWAERGWLGEVKAWLAQELARLGRTPVGKPEQVRHWNISAVLRQPTDSGDVYFKAVINHFLGEPRITQALAKLFPALTPKVLATEPTLGWMLLEPFRGIELTKSPFEAHWAAFRHLSTTQLESLAHRDMLLAAGLADKGLESLKGSASWLIRDSLELDLLTSDERERLRNRESFLLEKIDELAACGIPETLVHGDSHFNNIVADGNDITIFDWTNACWSHPFFDIALQYSHDRAAPERSALVEAYLEPWLENYDERFVRRAFILADSLSPLFYAQNYESILRAQEPEVRGENAGVVANYLRELF